MATPPAAAPIPEATLPDTIVRPAPGDAPRAYVVNRADLPPMPAVPPVPAIPVVPAIPTPVFGDYDSEQAFEAAMDAWGERMEIWGEDVERRFDGDWEDKMEAWGEEMEAWGEQVEALAADFDGNELAALAALESLSGLGDLDSLGGLAALAVLEEGVYAIDPADFNGQAEDIRRIAMRQAERERAHAEREQARAERQVAHQKRILDQKQRQVDHQARQVDHQQRTADAALARRDRRTGAQSNQKIRVTSDAPGSTVDINGKTLDVDKFRAKVMGALIEDGFITARNKSATVALSGDDLEVNGRAGTTAQAKRYAAMFKSANFEQSDSIVLKFKPDEMSVTLSDN
jgi:hypothetical protein